MKRIADAFLANGMTTAGYRCSCLQLAQYGSLDCPPFRYILLGDCWQVARFSDGSIVEDPVRFPSGMRSLSQYVHARNLRFGLYTAAGSGTCQGRPGSRGFEGVDSATYCGWYVSP